MLTTGKVIDYTTTKHITAITSISVQPLITLASQAHSAQRSVLFLLAVSKRANKSVGKVHTHKLEDFREIFQGSHLERRLDQASSKKFQSFHTVLSVSNVTSLDANHAKNCVQDRGLEICIWRQPNGNNCATGANIFGRLLERLFRNCE